MTKLEPTRTSSDLTATERLRRMLDERGADYRVSATGYSIDIGPYTTAYANRSDTTLDVSLRQVTPAQAIAATLGSCNCSNNCTDSERTEKCLPYFWTHDGVLHIELPKLPDSIQVRLPDQRDREVRSARVWRYTLDNGTCREVYLLMATDIGDGREEVLGVYATEEAAMAAINENQFGYALHHVRKWEVDV